MRALAQLGAIDWRTQTTVSGLTARYKRARWIRIGPTALCVDEDYPVSGELVPRATRSIAPPCTLIGCL